MAARVLILNSFIKGWNILKSLADDSFEVNAGDYRAGAPGLFSNRIKDKTKNLIYPNPKLDEKAFTSSVLEHIQKHEFDIVLPVNAAEMMALARIKNEILKYSLFPFENYHKLLLLHDKKYFHELISGICGEDLLPQSFSVGDQTLPLSEIMEKAGVGPDPDGKMPAFTPMENFPTADQFLKSKDDLNYPLIVKTRRATSAVGVYRVNSADQLRSACENLGHADIIIQQNLVGRGVGISAIRWDNPAMVHLFGHKRVREYPISGGASTSREPWDADSEKAAEAIRDLLYRLNWHGVVMFEFKEIETSEGQKHLFLEANPRFWGSVPLAIVNGVNFPSLLCRATLGMEIPEVKNKNSVRARIIFSDTLSLVLNILKGRRIFYNLFDYFKFWNLYLDDIDMGDFPATRKVVRQMLAEFFSRR